MELTECSFIVHVEGTTAAFHVMILTMTVWLNMFMSLNVKKGYVNGMDNHYKDSLNWYISECDKDR